MNLTSVSLKQAIRTKYAWPGGYQLFGITSDGGLLCVNCMRKQWRNIVWSRLNRVCDGWRVTAIDSAASLESAEYCNANADSYSLDYCDHCNLLLNN